MFAARSLPFSEKSNSPLHPLLFRHDSTDTTQKRNFADADEKSELVTPQHLLARDQELTADLLHLALVRDFSDTIPQTRNAESSEDAGDLELHTVLNARAANLLHLLWRRTQMSNAQLHREGTCDLHEEHRDIDVISTLIQRDEENNDGEVSLSLSSKWNRRSVDPASYAEEAGEMYGVTMEIETRSNDDYAGNAQVSPQRDTHAR